MPTPRVYSCARAEELIINMTAAIVRAVIFHVGRKQILFWERVEFFLLSFSGVCLSEYPVK